MLTRSIWTKLLVLIFSVSLLASCGGGGGGTPPPPSNEGSITSPVNIGTASTTITHAGSISADGISFYTFTTGSTAGTYTISLTNTHSDLLWAVLSDPGFTSVVRECDNYYTPGANNEVCSVTLTAGTTYYLGVVEWDVVAGTYTITIVPPGESSIPGPAPTSSNEGSIASPVSLGTASTTITHAGSIGPDGTSFYTFTTGSTAGSYTISLTNTKSDLSWDLYSNSGFTSLVRNCDNFATLGANNEICSATLTAGTTYYLATDEWDVVPGTFTLTITPTAALPPPSAVYLPPLIYSFDTGTLQGWTTNGLWSVATTTVHSGTYSVTDSPAGNYLSSSNKWLDSPLIDLTATTTPQLTFWHRYSIETDWDYGYVELSTNGGGTWANITPPGVYGNAFTGTLSTFTLVTIDLTPYKNSSQVVIRFRLQTDSSVNYDGWYIDDIGISVN